MSDQIGTLIRDLRKQRGLTQRCFAQRIGMHHTYVSKIENGRLDTIPSCETLVSMADVLDVHRDWLLTQCGRPPEGWQQAIAEHPELFPQVSGIDDDQQCENSDHLVEDAEDLPEASSSGYRLLGQIAAGAPIEAIEDTETFDLVDLFAPGEHYLLKIRGDSMIEDAILDGDIAIVRPQRQCETGEIVVAIVDGEDATLKRFYREGDSIRLQPANAEMAPIIVPAQSVEIRGKVVGVIRTRVFAEGL